MIDLRAHRRALHRLTLDVEVQDWKELAVQINLESGRRRGAADVIYASTEEGSGKVRWIGSDLETTVGSALMIKGNLAALGVEEKFLARIQHAASLGGNDQIE